MITPETLQSIRVLWRQSDTMALWGIPYGMRTEVGQSPRHLWDANNTKDWVWLGCPGWFYTMTKPEITLVREYLETIGDMVPEWPCEWSEIGVEQC